MAVKNSTDLGETDIKMLSFWLGLPAAVRYAIVILTILGAGWTARGVVAEQVGLTGRVAALEQTMIHVQDGLATATTRQEAILLFLVCSSVETQSGRSGQACQFYLRDHPDILEMVRAGLR